MAEKGERFLAELESFLELEVDPLVIERESKIPDHVVDGLKRLGALGMKVPAEYGGRGSRRLSSTRAASDCRSPVTSAR